MSTKRSTSFVKGAAILAAAGFFTRFLGAVYRIPLARLIGAEGFGLLDMAYPIYSLFLTASIAGFPSAISRIIAEKEARGERRAALIVLRVALTVMLVTGGVSSVVLFMAAKPLAASVFKNPKAAAAIAAIAPALLFVTLSSAFRGFFLGVQYVTPSAVSQVIEQLVRVGTMIAAALLLMPNVERAAAGAAFGAVTGGIFGLAYLIIAFAVFTRSAPVGPSLAPEPAGRGAQARQRGGRGREGARRAARSRSVHHEDAMGFWGIAKEIFVLAIPIALGASIYPIIRSIDAALVPTRLLSLGFSREEATALYGQLSGMALPIVNLPTVITTALSTSILPAITEAVSIGNIRQAEARASQGIRLTFLLALPAAAGLWLFATPIMNLLYDRPEAGGVLAAMALAVVFICLQQTTSGVLTGAGAVSLQVRNLLIGGVVKTVFNYWLTGTAVFGVRGAAMATVIGFSVTAVLNLRDVARQVGFSFDGKELVLKPGVAVLAMSAVSYGLFMALSPALGSKLAVLIAMGAAVAVYFGVLLLVGGVKRHDIEAFGRFGRLFLRAVEAIGIRLS